MDQKSFNLDHLIRRFLVYFRTFEIFLKSRVNVRDLGRRFLWPTRQSLSYGWKTFFRKNQIIKSHFEVSYRRWYREIQLTLKSETSRTSSCCVLLLIPVLLESSFLKKWWCSTVIRQILFAIPAVGQTKPILASVFRTEPARTFTKKKSRL